jgi:hypothetical protein
MTAVDADDVSTRVDGDRELPDSAQVSTNVVEETPGLRASTGRAR